MVYVVIKQMAYLTNPPTLEFRKAFVKGHSMSFEDIPLILQCKNIDFGHVDWPHYRIRNYYDNKQLMYHVIDNIVDINIKGNNLERGIALLCKICTEDIRGNPNNGDIVNYIMNNGCLNNLTFVHFKVTHQPRIRKYNRIVCFGELVNYLTTISLIGSKDIMI